MLNVGAKVVMLNVMLEQPFSNARSRLSRSCRQCRQKTDEVFLLVKKRVWCQTLLEDRFLVHAMILGGAPVDVVADNGIGQNKIRK